MDPSSWFDRGLVNPLDESGIRRIDVLLSDKDLYGRESKWLSSRRVVGLTGITTFLRVMFFQVILAQSDQYCWE